MNTYISYGWQEYQGYREHSQDLRRFFAGNFQIFPSERQRLTLILSHSAQESQIPGALSREQLNENRRQAHPSQKEKQAGRNQNWTRMGIRHRYSLAKSLENASSIFTYFYDLDHPLLLPISATITKAWAAERNFSGGYPGKSALFGWSGEVKPARPIPRAVNIKTIAEAKGRFNPISTTGFRIMPYLPNPKYPFIAILC